MNTITRRVVSPALALAALGSPLFAQGVLYDWADPAQFYSGDVAAGGDVNGDGEQDFASSQVSVQPGVPGRLTVRSGVDGSVLLTAFALVPGDGFGKVIEALGDVDGDGPTDFAVASSFYVQCIGGAGTGPLWQINLANVTSIAALSDFDGDGARDWALGAPSQQIGVTGLVQIRSGRTGALLFAVAPPPNASAFFGTCVAPAGDFDLDGHPDLVVGDTNGGTGNGAVSVHGIVLPAILTLISGPPNTHGATSPRFGASIVSPGDVDGDSVPELFVGSPDDVLVPVTPGGYDGGAKTGRARLISGATGAPLFDFTQQGYGAGFGAFVATYPDLDGDGRPELTMSAFYERAGCCHFFPGELRIHSSLTGQLLCFGGPQGVSRFVAVRDLDGDGRAELLCAASATFFSSATRLLLPFAAPPRFLLGCNPKQSSNGCLGWLEFSGSPSLSMGDDLRLQALGLRSSTVGLFLFGHQQVALPFGGGTLCIGGGVQRSAVLGTGGTTVCSGSLALVVPKNTLNQLGAGAGSVLFVQGWYRDSGFVPPNNIGLTGGLAITLWP